MGPRGFDLDLDLDIDVQICMYIDVYLYGCKDVYVYFHI